MSYFSGCHNLVKNKNMKLTHMAFFYFFICISFLQSSSAAAEDVNPLFDLSSREEMVQLAGYGEEKLSTVLVTGAVLCEACLHGDPQLRSWPIPGASVIVDCRIGGKQGKISSAKALTDEYGDFMIDLPSDLHAIPNLERRCCLKVLRIPRKSSCRPAHVRKHNALTLSSVGNGIRTYSAGNISFLDMISRPLPVCTNKRELQ
ncbi:hypothetical protein K2173_017966 [Erythroxylum novogranatense]|uniref:Pollen Ole e 1 allergen and extensin family protein n=1 Tax=Erythroxylum novogranatense TaxID=1862640 RepID=A0AAV8TXA3_9ROSI|nr:hypothetical protein K2173_017966 [Erythroxylum novogranatense]